MTYVLMFYLYTVSTQMTGAMFAAEFSSKETCEAAARQAKAKFDSSLMKGYYVCAPK